MPAWLSTTVSALRAESSDSVLGQLADGARAAGFDLRRQQLSAWRKSLQILRNAFGLLEGSHETAATWGVLLEFPIPRRQKRPDLILTADDLVLVVEFKVGAELFDAASKWQVQDYALDLRDFHEGSRDRWIVPILVATASGRMEIPGTYEISDLPGVPPVHCTGSENLATVIGHAYESLHTDSREPINPNEWERSQYRPALSIIEAAERLFADQTVREISHRWADNLEGTCDALVDAIRDAQRENLRSVCFVTGVPGSGKTLAGLSAVHDPILRQENRPAGIFLSGNAPLVRVVRAALERDARARSSPEESTQRSLHFHPERARIPR